MARPLIIAHRGDQTHAVENSLEAIDRALLVPVDMIEIDIRKSRDNGLYVLHDERTGRTGDPDFLIEQVTSEEIARVRLGNGEPLPTLGDALSRVAGAVGLNLEIKSDGAGALAAAHVLGSGYRGEVVITSFRGQEAADARRILPGVLTGEIFEDFSVKDLPKYRVKGHGLLSVSRKVVTRELVVSCHECRVRVFVWTVNDEDEMERLVQWGVDGIYSNNPGLLRRVVSGYNNGIN